MRKIERKLLGALLILYDDNMEFSGTTTEIANTMGYKNAGGGISLAMQILEFKNHIMVNRTESKNKTIKVLV
jgi:hypothetical protein